MDIIMKVICFLEYSAKRVALMCVLPFFLQRTQVNRMKTIDATRAAAVNTRVNTPVNTERQRNTSTLNTPATLHLQRNASTVTGATIALPPRRSTSPATRWQHQRRFKLNETYFCLLCLPLFCVNMPRKFQWRRLFYF